MNTYTEVRHLSAAALRKLCIAQDWYSCGDNDEYEHLLLDLAEHKENLTTADIIEIAMDIAQHSDPDDFEPDTDIIACIAYKVAQAANTRFIKAAGI